MQEHAPTGPELVAERRGSALWLTIAREARRNALSHTVLAEMAQAIVRAQEDRAVTGSPGLLGQLRTGGQGVTEPGAYRW